LTGKLMVSAAKSLGAALAKAKGVPSGFVRWKLLLD
jgi:hypothetical protein